MFYDAPSFNQNIGSWDVSSGLDFVSTEHSFGLQFKTIQNNTKQYNTIQYNTIVT
jgi:hypothetical protein